MPYKDLQKRREYLARYMKEVWYPKNKLKHLNNLRNRKEKLNAYILQVKKKGRCNECGFKGDKYPQVLEFHHLFDKSFSVAAYNRYITSVDSLKKEIEKCQLLCANCHRIKTFNKG